MKNKVCFLSMFIVMFVLFIISSCNFRQVPEKCSVTFRVNGGGCTIQAMAGGKEIKSGGNVDNGTIVTFTPIFEAGYKGVEWVFSGGSMIGNTEFDNNILALTITDHTTVTATVKKKNKQ